MKEEKIKELLKELFEAEYEWKIDKNSKIYKSKIISSEHKQKIETIIKKFLFDNGGADRAILEAKIFAYENIISNSNFAPVIKESKKLEV